jgi:hypothetical protein
MDDQRNQNEQDLQRDAQDAAIEPPNGSGERGSTRNGRGCLSNMDDEVDGQRHYPGDYLDPVEPDRRF